MVQLANRPAIKRYFFMVIVCGVGAEPDWVREKRERVEAFCGPSKRKEIIDVDAKILG